MDINTQVKPHQKRQWCWDNDIFIYAKVMERKRKSNIKIVIDIKGDKQIGEEIYKQTKAGQLKFAKKVDELYDYLYIAFNK
mgnify:FL=1|jgi:hypothetical protein|tara:strand:- start:1150 stop:1392 length:243 start_codon:yes stop_codon:yes gene_type:complete